MSPTATTFGFSRPILSLKTSTIGILLVMAGMNHAQEAVVPVRLPLDRYAKLKGDAPFAVATDVAKPAEEKIDWAESLYLSGASRIDVNGKEIDWVYINHKSDPAGAFQLYGNDPNAQGIQIVELQWDPESPAKTVVKLKKGEEVATLKRDLAAFTAPPVLRPPTASGTGTRPGQPTPVPSSRRIRTARP